MLDRDILREFDHRPSQGRAGNMDLDSSPTDSEGLELVLHFCCGGDQLTDGLRDGWWEVHHGNWNARDNTAGNLFTPWWWEGRRAGSYSDRRTCEQAS